LGCLSRTGGAGVRSLPNAVPDALQVDTADLLSQRTGEGVATGRGKPVGAAPGGRSLEPEARCETRGSDRTDLRHPRRGEGAGLHPVCRYRALPARTVAATGRG